MVMASPKQKKSGVQSLLLSYYRQPEGECVELRRCWQDKENRLKAETMRERVESRLKYMVIIEAARAAEIR